MSLLTPSQSFSHKWFHQCVNHQKKLSLRHPLPTFSFFQAFWLGVNKVLQNLIKVSSVIYFNVASWFPGNVQVKPHFNTQCSGGAFLENLNFMNQLTAKKFPQFLKLAEHEISKIELVVHKSVLVLRSLSLRPRHL